MKKIADISHHDHPINWDITRQELEFVIFRSSIGKTGKDERYLRYTSECGTTGTKDNGYKLYNQPRMKDSMEFKRTISQIEEYNVFPYCGVYLTHQLGNQNVYYISFGERIRAGR